MFKNSTHYIRADSVQCSSTYSLLRSSQIPELHSVLTGTEHQSRNNFQGEHTGHVSWMETENSGTQALATYLDFITSTKQNKSMERTHLANVTSFHVFFPSHQVKQKVVILESLITSFFNQKKVYLNIYIILLLCITKKN